ncbi:MAG TPA: small, acid-soluble spore protein, alpha/beta type [Syntrophomonadaceae bacterium]|nr:small, acid-soluble spore protein, alpha/beta type [Syntrophomonadaceae bacterium]
MGRNKGLMSEALKFELAKELGVYDIVQREGWGGVSSRNCGNLVRLAIERAERSLMTENRYRS